ncbi:MAG: cobalamin B12-binding domain-containing protein [Vicinamibacteria bacterium]
MSSKRIRVLIAKPGLDGHDVGAKVVARALRDAGFEVIYTGLKKSADEIARAASYEDVDVIGLSVLSGSHLPLCRTLKAKLEEQELGDKLWIVGGNIPRKDHDELKELGVDAVFATGTTTETIVSFLRGVRENVS